MNPIRLILSSPLRTFIFLNLFCIALTGCTPGMFTRTAEQLDDNIRLFNLKFESQAGHHVLFLVDPEFREGYMSKIYSFNERVRIMDSALITLDFIHDGSPLTKTSLEDQDFNSASVTFSYQLTISPSVTLESHIIKQKWVLKDDRWFVQPDLDSFFKSSKIENH
jgi:hypothetical protein